MSEKLRVGVVGTSWYAENFHILKFHELPNVELVALCGRNRARAEELAAKYAIPQVYTDFREMIAQAGLQALAVAAPDDLHAPITLAALEAGLHVLCEKPMALTAADAKAMVEKALQAGVKHMICHSSRWVPANVYVKQLLEEGYIGRCYQVDIREVGDYGSDYMWRFDRQHALGILGDLGSHMIDLGLWYVGDIAQVAGTLSTFVDRRSPDGLHAATANDSASLLLRFKNGAQGMIQVGAVNQVGALAHQTTIVLAGSEGTMELRYHIFGGVVELRAIRKGEKEFQTLEVPPELLATAYQNPALGPVNVSSAARAFVDSVTFDRVEHPTFEDGYKIQQVIEAVLESDQKGTWVSID